MVFGLSWRSVHYSFLDIAICAVVNHQLFWERKHQVVASCKKLVGDLGEVFGPSLFVFELGWT